VFLHLNVEVLLISPLVLIEAELNLVLIRILYIGNYVKVLLVRQDQSNTVLAHVREVECIDLASEQEGIPYLPRTGVENEPSLVHEW
jgi:hypothetical protein